mmetsp:Transcript_10668/g.25776  ORF Transcript_10668/g.25776 Transcript_10668/m.25776 type:complete len:206 (-) Transcript_10668:45-662(-)
MHAINHNLFVSWIAWIHSPDKIDRIQQGNTIICHAAWFAPISQSLLTSLTFDPCGQSLIGFVGGWNLGMSKLQMELQEFLVPGLPDGHFVLPTKSQIFQYSNPFQGHAGFGWIGLKELVLTSLSFGPFGKLLIGLVITWNHAMAMLTDKGLDFFQSLRPSGDLILSKSNASCTSSSTTVILGLLGRARCSCDSVSWNRCGLLLLG